MKMRCKKPCGDSMDTVSWEEAGVNIDKTGRKSLQGSAVMDKVLDALRDGPVFTEALKERVGYKESTHGFVAVLFRMKVSGVRIGRLGTLRFHPDTNYEKMTHEVEKLRDAIVRVRVLEALVDGSFKYSTQISKRLSTLQRKRYRPIMAGLLKEGKVVYGARFYAITMYGTEAYRVESERLNKLTGGNSDGHESGRIEEGDAKVAGDPTEGSDQAHEGCRGGNGEVGRKRRAWRAG